MDALGYSWRGQVPAADARAAGPDGRAAAGADASDGQQGWV